MENRYILFGGGELAVEIASYIVDCRSAASIGGECCESVITDIVSDFPPRRALDIQHISGFAFKTHKSVQTVENLDDKLMLICIGDPTVRHRIFTLMRKRVKLGTIIHPTAYVSSTASVGAGSVVCPQVFIGPYAELGYNCLVNAGAVVGHDTSLGDSTTLSPGAKINGCAITGEASFLGAGAVINPSVKLGSYSKLSAVSVLNKSVGDGFIMHGNPAKGRQMVVLPEGPHGK